MTRNVTGSKPSRRSFRPTCEALETRTLLTASLFVPPDLGFGSLPPIEIPTITPPYIPGLPGVGRGGDVIADKLTLTLAPGASDTYTLVLSEQPTADVTVTIEARGFMLLPLSEAGPGTDLTVSPTTLTFTAANWDQPQTVTVTASPDATTQVALLTHTVVSTDPNFDGDFVPPVLTFVEQPQPGVAIGEHFLTVTPDGAAVTYTVALTQQPTADVAIAITREPDFTPFILSVPPPDLLIGPGWQFFELPPPVTLIVTPTTLTFTPDNWSVPQTVTVSAPANTDPSWARLALLFHNVTSADPNYNGLWANPVTVHVQGSEVPPPIIIGPPTPIEPFPVRPVRILPIFPPVVIDLPPTISTQALPIVALVEQAPAAPTNERKQKRRARARRARRLALAKLRGNNAIDLG